MTRSPLEKAVVIPGDPVLSGLFLGAAEGEPVAAAVIAPAHPHYGGSMDNPVLTEFAHACSEAGVASLRFDWRGVGGSGGDRDGHAEVVDSDYAAALEELAGTVKDVPLVACGYAFGAGAALRVAARDPRVKRLVLVAPPRSVSAMEAVGTSKPMVVVMGERDGLSPLPVVKRILPEGAELVVIPKADHSFNVGLAELGRALRDALSRS